MFRRVGFIVILNTHRGRGYDACCSELGVSGDVEEYFGFHREKEGGWYSAQMTINKAPTDTALEKIITQKYAGLPDLRAQEAE